MTHSACDGESDCTAYEDLRAVWSLLTEPGLDLASKLERAFERATAGAGFDYAFLSRVDRESDTQWIVVGHGTHSRLQAGESVPLARTYCRETVAEPERTLRVSDALAAGWGDDPAYETFGLGCYLGRTVEFGGDVYGTLCLAGSDPRDEPIADAAAALVEMLAAWVASELHRWGGPPTRDRASAPLPSAAPEGVDELLDAVRRRPRRAILLTLLTGDRERDVDEFLDSAVDVDETALRHAHLPKLSDAGYVDWDPESGRVAAGPAFSAAIPLLRTLRSYAEDFGTG